MIRTEHLTMIVVLLFAVSMAWLQVAVGEQRTQLNLVPVPDYKAGFEMYAIRYGNADNASCGSLCGAFDLEKASSIGGAYMQVSLPLDTARR
ncbi:hypothetical protein ABIE64_001944 [Thalassospira sp. MBR-102]|jgi:hypothetical protein|uniref:hypothetical protein n=1 Tax=Thalassospira sp. MBR-102 TaxID=3156466 RepID=UPI0029F0589D|nr:hypothetical protein [Rhodospirillales bacterium]MBR9818187.1 hypothetical protein [Rhodospirillales bacterium]